MIAIRIISFNGRPPAQSLGVEFDERGGTIGRADTNQLALPDPDRHVSRLQARIEWRNARFEIANVGAGAFDVAGFSVASGSAVAINPGDRITVGGYVLEVSDAVSATGAGNARHMPAAGAAAPVDDPLALFGGASPADQQQPATDPRAAAPARTPERAASLFDDPFADTASTPRSSDSGSVQAARTPAAAGKAQRSSAVIPEDFDPFADPFAPPPAAAGEVEPEALDDLGFGPSGGPVAGPGIDALFGLGTNAPGSSTDPFAGGALGAPPPGLESGGASLDPLAAISGTPRPATGQSSIPDQIPEIRGAYTPPVASLPEGAFISWEQRGTEPTPQAETGGSREAEPLGAPPASGAAARTVPPALHAEAPRGPVEQRGARSSAPGADALLDAFLDGLGIADMEFAQGLTPETMARIGALLREATQGTLDLLLARAVTKREVRADATIILARDNNPLKFSPNADVALAHLLAPRGKGFLPPVEAMRDAYEDLRAHQLGFMAGMRAALAGVLQRFDPAVLEKRLSATTMLDSVLPMNRRARLWDQYTELYREIAREAEDDFHALFGREFLRAYEAQIERLQKRDA